MERDQEFIDQVTQRVAWCIAHRHDGQRIRAGSNLAIDKFWTWIDANMPAELAQELDGLLGTGKLSPG